MVDMTGGELLEVDSSTSLQAALEEAIRNIRHQYTLGFNPSNPGEAGSHHKLDIKLTTQDHCPGCKLRTRGGYYSGIPASLPSTNNMQPNPQVSTGKANELLIQQCIVIAGTSRLDLPDIPFKVETIDQPGQNGQSQLEVEFIIDPAGIEFKKVEGLHSCNLHIAIFYADHKGKLLDYNWKKLEARLNPEDYIRVMKEGFLYTTTVPIEDEEQLLKVVVYDETSNKIGSKLVTIH